MPAQLSHARAAALQILQRELAIKAQRLRNSVIDELGKPGTGRIYTHYYAMKGGRLIPVAKRNKPHQASAPGKAPVVDNGRLIQSITALQISPLHWRVGTNIEAALYLEFGTRRMAARPFLRPAADKERERSLRYE